MPENPLWCYWCALLKIFTRVNISSAYWCKHVIQDDFNSTCPLVTYFSLGMENQYSGFFFILENAWIGAVPDTDLLRGFPRCRHRYRGGSSAATAGRGISSINRRRERKSQNCLKNWIIHKQKMLERAEIYLLYTMQITNLIFNDIYYFLNSLFKIILLIKQCSIVIFY